MSIIATVTVVNKTLDGKVNVTKPAGAPVDATHWDIVRTTAGASTPYKLVATEVIGTSLYVDNIADANLGASPTPFSAQPNDVTVEHRCSDTFFAQGAALPAYVVQKRGMALTGTTYKHHQDRFTLRSDGRAT
jgi:hypothetical protein